MSRVGMAPAHGDATATELAAQARMASGYAATLEARVLSALCHAGERGLTAHEARVALGLPLEKHYSVAPRLSVMRKHHGWAELTGEARGVGQVYRATEAGYAHARTEGLYA